MQKPTTFQVAFEAYVNSLPPKKRTRNFLAQCNSLASDLSPSAVSKIVEDAEEKCSQKTSRRIIRKIIQPIVEALKAYDQVICTLVQADPMPSALIWGALKVIVDGSHRFVALFETIRSHLDSMKFHLQSINFYEDLYGSSTEMQNLFFNSYIHVLKFWSRVDKECQRCWAEHWLRSAVPFSTTKLTKIIADIETDANRIEKLAEMIEKGEAKVDRLLSDQERVEAKKERCMNAQWRKDSSYREVCNWIGASPELSPLDSHRINIANKLDGTCCWLPTTSEVQAWLAKDSTAPVLWVTGSPGIGKTVSCSYMINHVTADAESSVAFHFYQYNQQYPSIEILRCLAEQLFLKSWEVSNVVSEELYLQTQKNRKDITNVQNSIKILVRQMSHTYFFLDGLDEERSSQRWRETRTLVTYLISLASEFPKKVRLWCSSQVHPCVGEILKDFPTLDLKGRTEQDLDLFFTTALSRLDMIETSDEGKAKMLEDLRGKAGGSFLWASLMKNDLEAEINSLSEMKEFICHGLPQDLNGENGYYARIFKRIDEPQRRLACLVFSMVNYARRPLRVNEIRDAIGMIQSGDLGVLDKEKRPWASRLHKLFAPLIQVDTLDSEDASCKFVHSTIYTFIGKNPGILQDTVSPHPDRVISATHMAEACLLYLSQHRYASLLTRQGAHWRTAMDQPIEDHHLLQYAAKYWDKHLDDVAASPKLISRVRDFLRSPNFQTCLQVQSLWVLGHFTVYSTVLLPVRATFRKRIFPHWFANDGANICFWKDYRNFVHEWGYYLSYRESEHPADRRHAGELDRCFWKALGSANFLSKNKGRYKDFRLESREMNGARQYYDGFPNDGRRCHLLQFKSRSQNGVMSFICQTWELQDALTPTLTTSQTLFTNVVDCNWHLYKEKSSSSGARVGGARPVQFSPDGKTLRIGSQVFSEQSSGIFKLYNRCDSSRALPKYVEECASRGSIIVLTSRRKAVPATGQNHNDILDDETQSSKVEPASLETFFEEAVTSVLTSTLSQDNQTLDQSFSEHAASEKSDSSETDYGSSESDSGPAGDSAAESWSEGSTEPDADEVHEDNAVLYYWRDIEEISSSASSSEESTESGSESSPEPPTTRYGRMIDDSDDEAGPGIGLEEDGDSDGNGLGTDSGNDEPGYGLSESDDDGIEFAKHAPALTGHFKPTKRREGRNARCAVLQVFDTSKGAYRRLFHFKKPLRVMLYDSPPIIHPFKPLIVWPLSGGEVLFADYVGQSWFTRKLRTSSSFSRHIFMKCQFSECGQFLHIAALEGRQKPVSRRELRKQRQHFSSEGQDTPQGKPQIRLFLLVSTYRLSNRKTTRSPPWLIHRVRVDLGDRSGLSASKLPYTLTWTTNDLYVTASQEKLVVYRIKLFALAGGDKQANKPALVLVPRNTIFLPSTAKFREVRFFPADGAVCARVLIGSEDPVPKSSKGRSDSPAEVIGLGGVLSPPIGVYLTDVDLGGWIPSSDVAPIIEDVGIGYLDQKVERFDKDDDCDLEPYMF